MCSSALAEWPGGCRPITSRSPAPRCCYRRRRPDRLSSAQRGWADGTSTVGRDWASIVRFGKRTPGRLLSSPAADAEFLGACLPDPWPKPPRVAVFCDLSVFLLFLDSPFLLLLSLVLVLSRPSVHRAGQPLASTHASSWETLPLASREGATGPGPPALSGIGARAEFSLPAVQDVFCRASPHPQSCSAISPATWAFSGNARSKMAFWESVK